MNNYCKNCGKEIGGKHANGRLKEFCGRKCYANSKASGRKEVNLSRRLGLSSGETGQINEMLVSIDLIKRGYKVFLPFDTTSAFDLLVYKDNTYKRVQVKTGSFNYNGNKLPIKLRNSEFDILAVVYQLNDIDYEGL